MDIVILPLVDQHRQAGGLPQGFVRQLLDRDAQRGANQHRQQDGNDRRQVPVLGGAENNERADHDHVAVGKVQHFRDAVHHRVSQRDNRVDTAQADAVNQVGQEYHGCFSLSAAAGTRRVKSPKNGG